MQSEVRICSYKVGFASSNRASEELAHMVGNFLAGRKPMQKGLGTPVKVKKFWIDVIVPEGPPLEYERSG